MPDPNIVRVNNTLYSWASTRFTVNGDPWTGGLVAIEWAVKRERKLVHAGDAAGRPKGWTAGKFSVPTLKIRFLADSAAAFEAEVGATGAGSVGDAEWLFTLQAVEPLLPPNVPIVIAGNPCTITDIHEAREEGIDELVTEYDVMCLNLLRNGLPLWSAARAIPV